LDGPEDTTGSVAALEHLTGPSRGTLSWLSMPLVCVSIDRDRLVHLSGNAVARDPRVVAELRWTGQTYKIRSRNDYPLWINGKITETAVLSSGDMIEFGEQGPISRYRLLQARRAVRWSIDDMVGDSIAYLKASRAPLGSRVTRAAGDFGRRLVWETTIFFRITVILAIVGLGTLAWTQYRTTVALRESIDESSARMEGISAALAVARRDALRPSDLTALRRELGQRVEALEEQSGAAARLIARSRGAVALLQGAYGLRHVESGKFLRHVLGPDGIPLISPRGQPLLALQGNGPIAEVQFTGTAFLLAESGLLITNRHVAVPWESGTDPNQLAAQGMEPVVRRFIGYFPDRPEALETELLLVSEDHDLAVLKITDLPAGLKGLKLAQKAPRAGDEVIVMGFPTGLRSMLAQSGAAFIKELQEAKDTDFWSVAERLARAGHISPLASRGIVAQVGTEAILYDAETTHGGSGGPVLDAEGRVIAVNAAILPEFGGANLGVPVARLRELLARAMAEN